MAGPNGSIQGPAEGKWGYTTLLVGDWDGDGRLDVIVSSENTNWLRQERSDEVGVWLRDQGPLSTSNVQGHSTSPATVDFNNDGIPDLILGAEDGRIYYRQRQ